VAGTSVGENPRWVCFHRIFVRKSPDDNGMWRLENDVYFYIPYINNSNISAYISSTSICRFISTFSTCALKLSGTSVGENPRWVCFHRIFVYTCKQSNIMCSCCVWHHGNGLVGFYSLQKLFKLWNFDDVNNQYSYSYVKGAKRNSRCVADSKVA
jgi:hypothetical protein